MDQKQMDAYYKILEVAYRVLSKVEERLGDSPGIVERRKAGVDYVAAATRALTCLEAYMDNVPRDSWRAREITPRIVERSLNRLGATMGFTREQLDQGMACPALLVKYLVELRGEEGNRNVNGDSKGNV